MDSGSDSTAAIQTPLADALMRVTATGMASLHALPLSAGTSLEGSALRGKYLAVIGETYLTADVSWSGQILDTFFWPRSCLASAQRLAARAFGADRTLFITGGTTLANQIALEALSSAADVPPGRPVRVLADRTSHQSVHFWLSRAGADVTYCKQKFCCPQHGRAWPDLDDFTGLYQQAAEEGRPFDLVVLSAAGYDGCIIDTYPVLTELLQHTPTLNILADEAWGAASTFCAELSQYTALAASARISSAFPEKKLRMMVTHSAHKSLSALRQGSYLHISGDRELSDMAEKSLYRNHTTSPSLPILASLDLARAQACLEGAALSRRSLGFAQRLRRAVTEDSRLSAFTVAHEVSGDPRIIADPGKVLLDADSRLLSASDLRIRLARDYGLYAARTAGTGVLLNMHIGVTGAIFRQLLDALRDISMSVTSDGPSADPGDNGFVVAYPPGIPLTVPGQNTSITEDQRAAIRAAGADLFTA